MSEKIPLSHKERSRTAVIQVNKALIWLIDASHTLGEYSWGPLLSETISEVIRIRDGLLKEAGEP